MNAMKLAATTWVACLLAVSAVQAQTTLYTDSFNGPGTALNGTLVQGGTLQTGSVAWSANSAFLNNGTINLADEGSAILPFSPTVNSQYTLSMDVLNPSQEWIGLGFKNSALASPGASDVNDRYSPGGGISWMLYRNNGMDNAIELFGGPSATNAIPDINNQAGINFNVSNTLEIMLDTTGDGSSFTADFFVNGTSVSSGPQVVNQPLSAIQFVGLTYNNTADTAISYDNFLLTQTVTGATPNQWNVDGGGSFGVAGNWTEGTPALGSTVLFGGVLTAPNSPAVVTLNSPTTLGEVQFSNVGASYTIAGPSNLTLTGAARVATIAGNHTIATPIAGSAGLTKSGGGQLFLTANNTYSGTTNVEAGSLRVVHTGAVPGPVNVSAGASIFFEGDGEGGGFSGTFTPNITGAGNVGLSDQLTNETVTFNNAKGYTGQTIINGGTLSLTGSGTLGSSDGTAATATIVGGNQLMGRLALSGGVNVSNELLVLNARELAAFDAVHITSAGNNTWGGNIKGEVGGTQYNLESTSGTLTLGGTISAPDTNVRNFVFSGAGNFNITGKLVDVQTNEDGVELPGAVNNVNNVNVVKRGTGTLTIGTGTPLVDDYWRGTTVIEEGRLLLTTGGRLHTSGIDVRSGAIFEVEVDANGYPLQANQSLAGGGEVRGQAFRIFGDNLISPGDSGPGTLTFRGPGGSGNASVSISSEFGPEGGLAFDLADTTTVGGGVNDLITGVGDLTLSGAGGPIQVMVNPVAGALASGNYRLINYSGALNTTDGASFNVQLQGVEGPTRQTLAVSTATSGQVNLMVSGSAANLTWNGTAGNNTWDVNTSTNWTGADGRFFQLDSVTFGPGGVKDVTVGETVHPAVVTFNGGGGTTYNLTGPGGISGGATVNVNSGTVRLNNTGNAYSGPTTVASGARLEMGSAGTGGMTVSGTLAVPSTITSTLVDDFSSPDLSNYAFTKILDQGTVTNTSFSAAGGVLASTSTGADGAEQVLFLRNDGWNLGVGEELRVDNALTSIITSEPGDLGIVVGATPSAGVRANYLFVSFRGMNQLNLRGFNGTTEIDQVQAFDVNADQLFIARTGTDTVELGWYDGNTRNVMHTQTVANTSTFNNIGFYSDLREDGAGYDGLDNLQITTGSAFNSIDIEGDLNLAASGTIELDISELDFTSLNVAGEATLAGTLSIGLRDGFMPSAGSSYTFLTAAEGINVSGLTFNLPSLAGDLMWDTSDFANSGIISVASPGIPGDFDGDGVVDGHDLLAWQRNQSLGNLADWEANFGSGSPLAAAGTAVPEPSSLCLVAGLMIGLSVGRNRRRKI